MGLTMTPVIAGVEIFKFSVSSLEEGLSTHRKTDELAGSSSIEIIDPAECPSAGKDLKPVMPMPMLLPIVCCQQSQF